MKKYKSVTSLLIATAFALSIAGCATPQYSQQVTPATATNPAVTNSVVTSYVPNAAATQIGAQLQAISPAVPAPFGTAVDLAGWLLGVISLGAAGYANARRIAHLNTLQAVVTGVETALPVMSTLPGMTPQTAATALSAVKQSITDTTNSSGTQSNLKSILTGVGLG